MRSRKDQSGLTLVETVALMLIVLLVAGGFTLKRIGQQQMLERDSARKEHIRSLSVKLEEYKVIEKAYPAALGDLKNKGLISTVPVDPKTNELYDYSPTPVGCSTAADNCAAYSLAAKLENETDKAADRSTRLIRVTSGSNQ